MKKGMAYSLWHAPCSTRLIKHKNQVANITNDFLLTINDDNWRIPVHLVYSNLFANRPRIQNTAALKPNVWPAKAFGMGWL